MSRESVVAYRELSIRYAELLAVDGLSLEVAAGEMFGLIGPDGAGKTSTLRAALGLVTPVSGEVETCGLDPRRERRRLAQQVGYLSQRFSLYSDLSVDENLAFFAAIHGVSDWRRQRDELLELVRMAPFRKRLADRCQRVALMHRGRLLAVDEPEALRKRVTGWVVEVVARPRAAAARQLRRNAAVTQVETFGERLHVAIDATSHQQAKAVADGLGKSLEKAGLELSSLRKNGR